MPTSFDVFYLGVQVLMDPTEGNRTAENASALVGQTFGGINNALLNQAQSFTPAGNGFSGGVPSAYDMNNAASNDQFSIDGGPVQTFDATALYNATITYVDGTTATITAVVFQDINGNTYLAPEFSNNPDQAALEAAPIRSLTLDSLFGNRYTGLAGSRESFDYMLCFGDGTMIRTPDGERPVDVLRPGDLVDTLDHGPQPIRWIRGQKVAAKGALAPIKISQGALRTGVPNRDLLVSRQHRILVQSRIAAKMFDSAEVLVAAAKLTSLSGVKEVKDRKHVTYWHFLCDHHEVVFANGTPAETLLVGDNAREVLGEDALREIQTIFPDLNCERPAQSARKVPNMRQQRRLIQRSQRNGRSVLENWAV